MILYDILIDNILFLIHEPRNDTCRSPTSILNLQSCLQARDAVMASMVKEEEPTLPAELPQILPDNQLGMEGMGSPVGVESSTPPMVPEASEQTPFDSMAEFPEVPTDVGEVEEDSDDGLGDEDVHQVLNWKFLAQEVDCDEDEQPQPSPMKSNPPPPAAASSPEKVPGHESSKVTQYGPSATCTGGGKGGKGGVKRAGDFVDPYYHTKSLPPPTLSASAIYNRLHRVFQRKKDGKFLLDDRWNEMWADASGARRELNSIFEKVGYNVDRVYKMIL